MMLEYWLSAFKSKSKTHWLACALAGRNTFKFKNSMNFLNADNRQTKLYKVIIDFTLMQAIMLTSNNNLPYVVIK